jgi:hypothetical protein
MSFPIIFSAAIISQEGPCTMELISWTSVNRLHLSQSKDEVSEDDRRFIPKSMTQNHSMEQGPY